MIHVAQLWRHPIKSHGRESLDQVRLTIAQALPWDRTWAVAHEKSTTPTGTWAPCANFSIGAKAPGLMAISARLDEGSGVVTLSHPDLADITINPDTDGQALIDWSRPLIPQERTASARVVRLSGRGMTDTDYPSVSIASMASHRAVEDAMGRQLSTLRWRANIWLEGMPAWDEFDLVGKRLRIGSAEVLVREPIKRCRATTANPDTGQRDADTLGILNRAWGHQNFGIYCEVISSGDIDTDTSCEVLT